MPSRVPRPPDWWGTIKEWVEPPAHAITVAGVVLAVIVSVIALVTQAPLWGQAITDAIVVFLAWQVVGRLLIRGMVSKREYQELSGEYAKVSEDSKKVSAELSDVSQKAELLETEKQQKVTELEERDKQIADLREKYSRVVVSPEAEANDAFAHLTIEEPLATHVVLFSSVDRYPMGYAIPIRNGRPYPVQIIGYDLNVRDSTGIFDQTVSWRAPAALTNTEFPPFLGSAGQLLNPRKLGSMPTPVDAFDLAPDRWTSVIIPVDIHDIVSKSANNPEWYAVGHLHVRCGSVEWKWRYDQPQRYRRLTEPEWALARSKLA